MRAPGVRGIAVWLALLLAAGRVRAQEARAGGQAAPDYSWAPIVAPGDSAVPDPPGGKWLVDGEGLQYTLFRWEKHPGYYDLDDDDRAVTMRNGVRFIVEHHDDRYLYLRWYRTGPIADGIEAARTAARAAADVAAFAPSYRREIPEQDLLRLEPWDEGLPRAGQWRNGFAVADLDGDGHLDLAHGPPRKGPFAEPVVFLSDGAGHWRRWVDARFPSLPYDYGDIAAGDLDGDGRMDLALTAHNSGLFALYGDGRGRFESRSEGLPLRRRTPPGAAATQDAITTPRAGPQIDPDEAPQRLATAADPPVFTSRAIALADWNRDGRLDILALAEGPTAARDLAAGDPPLGKVIFLNRQEGRWQALMGPGAIMGDTILPVDLDRDGRLDFVTDSRVAGSAELLNYGAPEGAWTVASLLDPPPGLRATAIAVADLDADGRHDLTLAFKSRAAGERVGRWGLDVLFGTATPAGWRRSSVWGGDAGDDAGVTALATGDLDGDGDSDLVALAADGTTSLLINDGSGTFALERAAETDPGPEHRFCAGYSAAIVDLDGDGRAELVAAFAGEPGSEALALGAVPTRCRAQGALRVWKVSRSTAPSVPDR